MRTLIACLLASSVGALRLRYLTFEQARQSVQRQGLRTSRDYQDWRRDSRRYFKNAGLIMPENPDEQYADDWQGWDDWLGIPLPYEEAAAVVGTLGIRSQEHWWSYSREHADELLQLRVPSRPHLFYGSKIWRGYDAWLGLPDTPLVFPSSWGKQSHE